MNGELARTEFTAGTSDARTVYPVPFRAICCGLSLLVSAIDMVADRVPWAPGLNTTEIEQEAAAATLEPHVLL